MDLLNKGISAALFPIRWKTVSSVLAISIVGVYISTFHGHLISSYVPLGLIRTFFALFPLLYFLAAVVVPFQVRSMHYELGLDYWDSKYRSEYGVSGVSKSRVGTTPPVYPNGWFKVANSWDVPRGSVKNVHFWGKDLVLFRNHEGQVAMVDAYCSHLGAHLGVGGKVTSDGCLQCPFHGWKFDASGKCVEIPYSQGSSIPAQAHLKKYVVEETHRVILAWFDAEGREPWWHLQEAWPQIPSDYNYMGVAIHHIPCHISEVPENGADVAHLNFLHTDVHPVIRFMRDALQMKFVWNATWKPADDLPSYVTDMTLEERFIVMGHQVGMVGSDAVIRQIGPGLVVLSLQTFFGNVILLQSLTPEEPYHQRLETLMFASPNLTNFTIPCRLMLHAYAENVERDVLIWGKKKYYQNPVVVKGDGPITKFRKFYSQFYSEHSPTWESIQEELAQQKAITNW